MGHIDQIVYLVMCSLSKGVKEIERPERRTIPPRTAENRKTGLRLASRLIVEEH